MCSVKSAKSLHKILGGDFEFGSKINPTHPSGHPNIWTLALRSILRVLQTHLCLRLEKGEFDHLHKMLPSTKGLKHKDKTYCGPWWHMAWAIYKKRKIWNQKFFHVQISQFLTKIDCWQKSISPTPPFSQMVPKDNLCKKLQNKLNLA